MYRAMNLACCCAVELYVKSIDCFVKNQTAELTLVCASACSYLWLFSLSLPYLSVLHNIQGVPGGMCQTWEGVPYVKVYRYNPKHLCPKLNGYGDNGQRKVWSSGGSTYCTCQLTTLSMSVLECGVILRQFSSRSL